MHIVGTPMEALAQQRGFALDCGYADLHLCRLCCLIGAGWLGTYELVLELARDAIDLPPPPAEATSHPS